MNATAAASAKHISIIDPALSPFLEWDFGFSCDDPWLPDEFSDPFLQGFFPESDFNSPISSGIGPLNELDDRSSCSKFASSGKTPAGISPESVFFARINRCSCRQFLRHGNPDHARLRRAGNVHARDASPAARRIVILVPVGKRRAASAVHGGLERQQRQSVSRERISAVNSSPKNIQNENYETHTKSRHRFPL
nr:Os12g0235650 [Ipomoea batatas]